MRQIIRYVNRMPFRFTVPHFYPLGDSAINLNTQLGWDIVRSSHPHFETPINRKEWLSSFNELRDGQDKNMRQRAEVISSIIHRHGFRSLHSVGVGSAALEYLILQRLPKLELVISEFNAESVRRLDDVFPEATPKLFDVTQSSWEDDSGDDHLVLIYRLDPQLSDHQWRKVFQDMERENVKNILYLPSKFLTLRELISEIGTWTVCILKREPLSFAGYKRTRKQFLSYWQNTYNSQELKIGYMTGFLLTKK